ncbi:hypothetical protein PMAYCL1PPCAC_22304, partial [Pristionchus mayeri]
ATSSYTARNILPITEIAPVYLTVEFALRIRVTCYLCTSAVDSFLPQLHCSIDTLFIYTVCMKFGRDESSLSI